MENKTIILAQGYGEDTSKMNATETADHLLLKGHHISIRYLTRLLENFLKYHYLAKAFYTEMRPS